MAEMAEIRVARREEALFLAMVYGGPERGDWLRIGMERPSLGA